MQFIETPVFTKRIISLLSDKEYQLLQFELTAYPERGDIIKNSGGLRKIRWAGLGRGKSGGIRVIYYFDSDQRIYMLFAFAKNEIDDLSSQQLKILTSYVQENIK